MEKKNFGISIGGILALIAVVLLAVLPIAGMPRAWTIYAFMFFIYLAMANMWNLIAGYSGLISLCQPAFLGITGYFIAIGTWVHIPWWAGLIGGAVVSGIFALLIAFTVFRLTGIYFSIGTLVIPEALRQIFYIWRPVGGDMVGGGAGYTIKGLSNLGINQVYWLALVVALASVIIVRIVLRSKLGLGLAAIRDNQRAASGVGINTFKLKLYPFIIGAVITGLAGGVFYIYQQYIEPASTFNVKWTMLILLSTVIGGLRTEGGPIIGSIVVVFLYFALAQYGDVSLLIQGIILIAIMLLSPQGIIGIAKKSKHLVKFGEFLAKPIGQK